MILNVYIFLVLVKWKCCPTKILPFQKKKKGSRNTQTMLALTLHYSVVVLGPIKVFFWGLLVLYSITTQVNFKEHNDVIGRHF